MSMAVPKSSLIRMFDHMDEGVMIVDALWNILYANEFARRNLGIASTDTKIRDALIPLLSQGFLRNSDIDALPFDTGEDERSITFDAESPAENSASLMLSIYMSRPGADGARFVLLRDVSLEREEQAVRDRIISGISHKLMTPLTVINLHLQNLSDGVAGPLAPKQIPLVEKAREKFALLHHSLRRLIEFASIPLRSMHRDGKKIDAAAVAERFCRDFAKDEKRRRITLRVIPPSQTAFIFGSEKHFCSALETILDNAVKFHPGEEVAIELSFALSSDGRELSLTLRDDGPGIPRRMQKLITKGFLQCEDDFTGNVEGMGIGLAMLSDFMKLFGGRLAIDSSKGKGTTVNLFFPLH